MMSLKTQFVLVVTVKAKMNWSLKLVNVWIRDEGTRYSNRL